MAFLCSQTLSGVKVGVSSLFVLLQGETAPGVEKGKGLYWGGDGQRVPGTVSLPASPKASSVTGTSRRAFARHAGGPASAPSPVSLQSPHTAVEQTGRAVRAQGGTSVPSL